MSREAAILATLIAYKVALLVIGFWAERRTKDGDDFVLAGRRMGPVVAALSASASSSSAWTLLGVSGLAFTKGLSALWVFPGCVGGFCINWFVLARPLRAHAHAHSALTVTDVIAGPRARPGAPAIRIVASVLVLVSLLTYVASQFLGAGNNLSETFQGWNVDDKASIVVGAAIVVAYTLLGGFWAVSVTDTLQGFVMAATAIVLPIAAVLELGVGGFVDGIAKVDVPGFQSVFGNLEFSLGIGFVLGLLGIGLGYPGQPHVVNRFMAMRLGERELRTGRIVAIGWAVVVYAGMLVLGLAARVLYPEAEGEKAFLTVANGLFPPVVAGIMVAAVLSAVMSTTDSQLLVAGSTVTHDLGLGNRTQRSLLISSRIVILVMSVCAVAFVLLTKDRTIFSLVLFAWSSLGAAFGPLLLVIVLRGPVKIGPTLLAMVAGWGLSVGFYYARSSLDIGTWSPVCERVLPFAVALAIALCGVSRGGVRRAGGAPAVGAR
ncbi:MAG: sodium/proline symporter [Planctomycetes bacterium]|nr:sodium/proline symporter [Planctomycetota bacterium]